MIARSVARFTLFLFVSICCGVLSAGEVQMSWQASESADGYRVHRGPSLNNYVESFDVGDQTSASVDGIPDCQMAFMAVTAYNEAGESEMSGHVESWPRPVLLSATPGLVEQGSSVEWTVTGLNFREGDAVGFSEPGISVTSVSVDACQMLRISATVSEAVTPGAVELTVSHPSGVAQSATLIEIMAPASPTVVVVSPQSGDTDVPHSVQPFVQFSEAVSGVGASTVRLLDAGGVAVPQSGASPIVSGDGMQVTIVPAEPLAGGESYRISVIGGPGGIVDSDGNPMASDYLQSPAFTTAGDETGPELSDIEVDAVDGTSATIVWNTDEASSSRLYYRKQGGASYMEVGDEADVDAHSLTASGLEPETTYEFHVSSTDGSGNGSTSDNATFTTTESSFAYLRIEAEAGTLEDPLDRVEGNGAFAGQWISPPPGLDIGNEDDPLGTAVYGLNAPAAGAWTLWVRMWGGDGDSNSFFESMDGSIREKLSIDEYETWVWIRGTTYQLEAGQHQLELGGRESSARADRVLLTNDPDFVPNEEPDLDTSAPEAVSALSAEPVEGLIQLRWENPVTADLERVVVRYSTDGSYPLNIADGLLLSDREAIPDALDGVDHEGVVPELLYRYSVFSVDRLGNVSSPAHVEAAIFSPPPAPQNLEVY